MRTTVTLAIDTASPTPAVTLLAGENVFDEHLPPERQASERLLAAIESVFERAGLSLPACSRIAVCAGPGSFTGVRVGLATAWGLGRAIDRPVEAVSTLEAMAEAAADPAAGPVAVALDAGRGEIIWQVFLRSGPRARAAGPPARTFPEAARAPAGDVPWLSLPAGLVAGATAPGGLLSTALARAVAREPSRAATPLEAFYSRPSAAEEKYGSA